MDDTNTEPIVLTYWENTRGPVQPLIYLLEYLKVPYTFETIKGPEEYKAHKKALKEQGDSFPNLPNIRHKGRYISETRALAEYICTVAGRTDLHAGHTDIVEWIQLGGILSDTFWDITRPAYAAKDLEDLKKIYKSWALLHHPRFEEMAALIRDRGYVLGGDKVTFLDFLLAEVTEKVIAMETDIGVPCLSVFDGIKQHHEKVIAIPEIAAYREKNPLNLVDGPWNNPDTAIWY